MPIRPLLTLFVAIALSASFLAAQNARSPVPADVPPITLSLGTPIDGQLRGGETRSFLISGHAGDYIQIVLRENNLPVKETLLDSTGAAVASASALVSAFDTVTLCTIVPRAADYQLQVTSLAPADKTDTFDLRLTDAHSPSPTEQIRAKAQQTDSNAAALLAKGDRNSSQKAATQFQKSATLWQSAGDVHAQAISLYATARAYRAAGDRANALAFFKQALALLPPGTDAAAQGGANYFIAAITFELKHPADAIPYYERAIPLFAAVGSLDDEAYAYNGAGHMYDVVGDRQKALDDYNLALPLFQQIADIRGQATVLQNRGLVRQERYEIQPALDDYNQAIKIFEALNDQRALAVVYGNEGLVYGSTRQWQPALDAANKALAINQTLKNQEGIASDFRYIGADYDGLGRWKDALDELNSALQMFQMLSDNEGVATTLMSRGGIFETSGAHSNALADFQQAQKLFHDLGEKLSEAGALDRIAGVYDTLGQRQQSLDDFNQVLAASRESSNPVLESAALRGIGKIYDELGDAGKALADFYDALTISRALGDQDSEAVTLDYLAGTNMKLGNGTQPIELANQALAIFQSLSDTDGEAETYSTLGAAHFLRREWRAALDADEKALPLQRSFNETASVGNTLEEIADCESELGNKQEAIRNFNDAIALLDSAGDQDAEAATYVEAGRMYEGMGRKQDALDDYSQALVFFATTKNPFGEAAASISLMRYWKSAGRNSLAILFGKQGIDQLQVMRANIQSLPKSTQTTFASYTSNDYRELANLLVGEGRLTEAQQVLDQLKLQEYFEYSQRRGGSADPNSPVTLTRDERTATDNGAAIEENLAAIGARWTELKANPVRTPDEQAQFKDLTDKIDTARRDFRSYMDGLRDNFGKGDQANTAIGDIRQKAASVQGLLQDSAPGTVALYTIVMDTKTVILVITPTVMLSHEIQVSKTVLQSKVNDFVGALANEQPENEFQPKAQALYTLLVAPLEKDLAAAHATTLVWSLDGVLRYLPLAALYDGKQYLAERFVNAELTTASLGNLKDQPKVASWSGLAMGISKDYQGLGPLTAVPAELDSVVTSSAVRDSHGPIPGTIMLNDSFTKASMEDALDNPPPLVHIATHFVFNPGDDQQSFLLLGGEETGGKGYHLSLTDFRDDARIDFHGVELLTLSGCDTAMGSKTDSDGREVDSLGIVGQMKDAKAVVATLWPIDDTSVGQLMQTFYHLWTTTPGITKSEALRQAQLALLHGTIAASGSTVAPSDAKAPVAQKPPFANPYYWAPFILMGNWK